MNVYDESEEKKEVVEREIDNDMDEVIINEIYRGGIESVKCRMDLTHNSCKGNFKNIIGINTNLHAPTLIVGSLNINGLNKHKLTNITNMMRAQSIDVVCLQDTRVSVKSMQYLKTIACEQLGVGSVAISFLKDTAGNQVGGQLFLIQNT